MVNEGPERQLSLASEDLLNSFFRAGSVGGFNSLPHISSECEIQDFLKRIPSTANLLNGADTTTPGEKPPDIPRVPSLDAIKAYINIRQQGTTLKTENTTQETSNQLPPPVTTPPTDIPNNNDALTAVPPTITTNNATTMGPMQFAAAAAAAAGAPLLFNPQSYLAAAFIHSQLAQQQASGQIFPLADGVTAQLVGSNFPMLIPTAAVSDGIKSGQSSGDHAHYPTESGGQNEGAGVVINGGGANTTITTTVHRQRTTTTTTRKRRAAGNNTTTTTTKKATRAPPTAATTTTTGGDNDDDDDGRPLDDKQLERKRRRMLSNRESARRSRKRKQDHVVELEAMVARMMEEHSQFTSKIAALTETVRSQEARITTLQLENERLVKQQQQSIGAVATTTATKGGRSLRHKASHAEIADNNTMGDV